MEKQFKINLSYIPNGCNEVSYISSLNDFISGYRVLNKEDLIKNYPHIDNVILDYIERVNLSAKYDYSVLSSIRSYLNTRSMITHEVNLELIKRLMDSIDKKNIHLYSVFSILNDWIEDITFDHGDELKIVPSLDGTIYNAKDLNIHFINSMIKHNISYINLDKLSDTSKYVYSLIFSPIETLYMNDESTIAITNKLNTLFLFILLLELGMDDSKIKELLEDRMYDKYCMIVKCYNLVNESNEKDIFGISSELVKEFLEFIKNNGSFADMFTRVITARDFLDTIKKFKELTEDDIQYIVEYVENIILNLDHSDISVIYSGLLRHYAYIGGNSLPHRIMTDDNFKNNRVIKKVNMEYVLDKKSNR